MRERPEGAEQPSNRPMTTTVSASLPFRRPCALIPPMSTIAVASLDRYENRLTGRRAVGLRVQFGSPGGPLGVHVRTGPLPPKPERESANSSCCICNDAHIDRRKIST